MLTSSFLYYTLFYFQKLVESLQYLKIYLSDGDSSSAFSLILLLVAIIIEFLGRIFQFLFFFFFFLFQIYTISCTIFRTIIQDFEICKFTKFPEDFKHFVKSNRGKNRMEETMGWKNRHSTDLERLKSFTDIQSI